MVAPFEKRHLNVLNRTVSTFFASVCAYSLTYGTCTGSSQQQAEHAATNEKQHIPTTCSIGIDSLEIDRTLTFRSAHSRGLWGPTARDVPCTSSRAPAASSCFSRGRSPLHAEARSASKYIEGRNHEAEVVSRHRASRSCRRFWAGIIPDKASTSTAPNTTFSTCPFLPAPSWERKQAQINDIG